MGSTLKGSDERGLPGACGWQQGDYTLDLVSFPVINDLEQGELAVDTDPVVGFAVVTQTCDIVNNVADKQHVTICPLVEVSPQSLQYVRSGRTPGAAVLQHPPSPNVVVDLGRMASLHKSVLGKVERRSGFSSDEERMRFADSLERKFGRFAFPDTFNNEILSKLKDRILRVHEKSGSDNGKSYRSIGTARVTSEQGWESSGPKSISFHFVLTEQETREATREEIRKTLDGHFEKLVWPNGYKVGDPPYHLVTREEMTVSEWLSSQPIDWEFISSAGQLAK